MCPPGGGGGGARVWGTGAGEEREAPGIGGTRLARFSLFPPGCGGDIGPDCSEEKVDALLGGGGGDPGASEGLAGGRGASAVGVANDKF